MYSDPQELRFSQRVQSDTPPVAKICFYQTPGERQPLITGRRVITVTSGCVGAPKARAPFRFHDAVVGLVHRCLLRTQNLRFELNISLSVSQADLVPKSTQGLSLIHI